MCMHFCAMWKIKNITMVWVLSIKNKVFFLNSQTKISLTFAASHLVLSLQENNKP